MSAQPFLPPSWDARAGLYDSTDEEAFRCEQEAVAARCWTVLGLAADLRQPGDWIMGNLGPWEVCVQNFGSSIRAFKNYCAHRFFPLRSESRGNGPLRCPFHGWTYNEEGRAVGIPQAEAAFGCPSEEMNRRLRPVEVAICGPLVFGRLQTRPAQDRPSLDAYLGEVAPYLNALASDHYSLTPMGVVDKVIKANWKTVFKLALDDYHIVAVHPRTLGSHGNLQPGDFLYQSLNIHTAILTRAELRNGQPDLSRESFEDFVAQVVAGRIPQNRGAIFSIFPNTIVSLNAGVVCVNKFAAVSPTETRQKAWLWRIGAQGATFDETSFRLAVQFSERILDEDKAVAETMQRNAGLGFGDGLLGAQEERIGWFNKAYLGTLAEPREPAPRAPAAPPSATPLAALASLELGETVDH